jgi:hypothetical protein
MKKRVVFTQDYTSLGMPGSGGVAAACYRAGNYVYVTGQAAFTLEGRLVGWEIRRRKRVRPWRTSGR